MASSNPYLIERPSFFDEFSKGVGLGLSIRAASDRAKMIALEQQKQKLALDEFNQKSQDRQQLRDLAGPIPGTPTMQTNPALTAEAQANPDFNGTGFTPLAVGEDATKEPTLGNITQWLATRSGDPRVMQSIMESQRKDAPPTFHPIPGGGTAVQGRDVHVVNQTGANAQSPLGKLISDRDAAIQSGAPPETIAAYEQQIKQSQQPRGGGLNPYDARAMAQYGTEFRNLQPGSLEQKNVIAEVDKFKEQVIKLQLDSYGLRVRDDQRIPPAQLDKITDLIESDQLMAGIADAHAKAFPKNAPMSAALQGAISKNNTIRTIKEAVLASSELPAEQEFVAQYNLIISRLRKLSDERQLSELDAARNLQSFNPAVSTEQFQKNVATRRAATRREITSFTRALRGQGRDTSVVEGGGQPPPRAPGGTPQSGGQPLSMEEYLKRMREGR